MQSQTKKALASTLVVVGSLLCVMDANAACTKTGVITASFASPNGSGTYYNVVPLGQLQPTFIDQFFVAVPTSSFNQVLSAAQTGGQLVTVVGTGSSGCSTVGTVRNQGNVTGALRFAQ